MPQTFLYADGVQIEPGTTTYGLRSIDRDDTDGSLRFIDPTVTASLSSLLGSRNITGMYPVGGGDGAAYATIQAAIDAVPDSATVDAPAVIPIYGGVYTENLTIIKDGVHLVGMGGAVLRNTGAFATVTLQEGATVPLRCVLQNLRIENTDASEECILVDGSSTFASATVTVVTVLVATDTITIGGTALTAVTGTRASGSDNFSVDGATTDTIAVEIAAAINDTGNSFAATVSAIVVGAVVTITAITAGATGNTITLAVATTPTGGMTVSAALLSGGGASPTLLSDGLYVVDCDLVASGTSGRQVVSSTANNVYIQGGSWWGSSNTSVCQVTQTSNFRLFGVAWTNNFEFSYSTASTEPSAGSGAYEVAGCGTCGDFLVNLVGAGGMALKDCPEAGTVAQGGDQALLVSKSSITTLELNDTTAGTLLDTRRTTASVTTGTPTLTESQLTGTVTFAASSSEVITFDIPQPDAVYSVYVDSAVLGSIPQATARTTSDFTLSAAASFSGDINYLIVRQA